MSKTMLVLFLALSLNPAGASPASSEEADRRQAVVHQRQGEQLLRSERFEEAVQEFRQALALDPLLVIAHFNLGQAHMALKHYPDAVSAYQGCANAVRELANVGVKEREQRDRATEEEIRELRNSLVQLRSGRFKLASVDAMVLRVEERIRVLEDSRMKGRDVAQVPAEVHLGLGSAYFRQNQLAEAERAYADAVRGNKKLGAAHNNLAVIYMLTDRLPQARAAMNEAQKTGFPVDARFKADLETREQAAKP